PIGSSATALTSSNTIVARLPRRTARAPPSRARSARARFSLRRRACPRGPRRGDHRSRDRGAGTRPASVVRSDGRSDRAGRGRAAPRPLRTHYGAEGEADVLLIDLPKGGYVPRFTERRPAVPSFAANVLRLHVLPPNGTAFDAFAVSP